MALLSLYPQFETNLTSNSKVILKHLLQLTSAKAHGKNCTKVKQHLVRHLLRNGLLLPVVVNHIERTTGRFGET